MLLSVNLFPAGTGMNRYRKVDLVKTTQDDMNVENDEVYVEQ